MINRVCISINNACNLNCKYCHFHEKHGSIRESAMNIYVILDNIRRYIEKYQIKSFKIGFVGNGEPLLNFCELKSYIEYIEDLIVSKTVLPYIVTNGLLIDVEKLCFFKDYNVNVGFSIDGDRRIHNEYRCNSFDSVMKSINLYRDVFGVFPSMNCTVGKESMLRYQDIISFFSRFNNRVTFSRMIGQYGISLSEYNWFIENAKKVLNVRTGGYDCTMYGGLCGAGLNNYFFANGRIFLCGNCIDQHGIPYDTPLENVEFNVPVFDRNYCFKESFLL